MRKLGPRQLEWIERIREGGGRVGATRGWHGQVHFYVANPYEAVPVRIVESLIARNLLMSVDTKHRRQDYYILSDDINAII